MNSHFNKLSFDPPFSLAKTKRETPVLLALSGGADSSALLHLLAKDAAENGYMLYAAHFNHRIRGEEALRDLEFCRSACERLSVPFISGEADVPALAKAHGTSLEAEAREQRYAFFVKIMRERAIPLLATAHHAGDHVESVILHLLRGSGVAGLCGISGSRTLDGDLYLVRPLLKCKKEDILEYCDREGIAFVTDSTNYDTAYQRNSVRANIVPQMRAIQPELESVFARMSENLAETNELIEDMAGELLGQALTDDGLLLAPLNCAHGVIAKRALAIYFKRFSDKMLERAHIDALISLCAAANPHSALSLPDGIKASIENASLILSVNNAEESNVSDYEVKFRVGETLLPCGIKIKIEEIIFDSSSKILKNTDKKDLNIIIKRGRINNTCFFKNRDPSDVISLNGMRKKIKKLMCDNAIPLSLRDRLPILCRGQELLWVPMLPPCDELRHDSPKSGDACYHVKIEF